MPRAQHRKKKERRTAFLRGTLIILACLFAVCAGALLWYLDIPHWENLDPDKILNLEQTLHVYDKDDQNVAAVHYLENRTNISLSQVPQHVINAILAVEDVRFYSHHGVDLRRIAGALLADIKSGELAEGASTLTQQLIKNTHLSTEKSWRRKAQEAWLAWQLENMFSKDDILEMYLNYIYFGGGAYGIEAAAQRYFGKSVSDVTLAEGALLAGILKGTGIYAPHINLEKSIQRRNIVLGEMVDAGYITEKEATAAKKEPVNLVDVPTGSQATDSYVDAALSEAAALLNTDYDSLVTSGYRVYTYMDTDIQQKADELMADETLFPQSPTSEQVEAAVVLLASDTGGVAALIGGRDYASRGFNRAIDAKRQPGSAIKPILVYGPALDLYSYTAATLLLDEPVDYSGYSPKNFDGAFRGWTTLREALVQSLNVPAVRVLHDIGLTGAMEYATRAGIPFTDADQNLTIALGGMTEGVSPLQLARSYLPLSNGGFTMEPTLIRRIETPEGKVVYEHQPDSERVMNIKTSFILSDILKDAVLEGTGKRLRETGIPLAAKTGTVSDGNGGIRDAWIAAYNPDYVLTVWMGYDHTLSMGQDATGGSYPAAIASHIFSALYEGTSPPVFLQPDGVVQVALDKKTLDERHEVRLAGDMAPAAYRVYEYFTLETVPTQMTDYWVVPDTPDDLQAWTTDSNVELGFTATNPFAAYRIEKKGPGDAIFYTVATLSPGSGFLKWTDENPTPGANQYRVVPLHPEIIQNGAPLAGDPSGIVTIDIEDTNPFHFPFNFPWFRSGNDTIATTPVPAQTPAGTPSPLPSPTPFGEVGRSAA